MSGKLVNTKIKSAKPKKNKDGILKRQFTLKVQQNIIGVF